MQSWEKCTLKDIVEICYGKNQKEVENSDGIYDILGTGGVIGNADDYLYDKPSVLIGRKGTIDKPMYIERPFWTVDTLFYTKFKRKTDVPKWLYYYLNYIDLKKYNEATGVPSLSTSILNKISIMMPPENEQIKMVEIFSTVDDGLDSLDSKIKNLQELKKALAKKLLTEGIGHTEFKDSEVGRIPVEWEDCNINTVAKRNTGHTPDKKHNKYWNGNIAWISLKDLGKLDSREICETYSCTTDLGIENSSAVVLDKGTVVISRDATVGKIGIMGIDMATSQHFVNFTCGKRLSCKYLYYWLLGHQEDFKKIAIGSTIKTIGMKYFEKMRIALPELEEQEKIANILWNMDDCIESCKNQHTDLTQLKEALS